MTGREDCSTCRWYEARCRLVRDQHAAFFRVFVPYVNHVKFQHGRRRRQENN